MQTNSFYRGMLCELNKTALAAGNASTPAAPPKTPAPASGGSSAPTGGTMPPIGQNNSPGFTLAPGTGFGNLHEHESHMSDPQPSMWSKFNDFGNKDLGPPLANVAGKAVNFGNQHPIMSAMTGAGSVAGLGIANHLGSSAISNQIDKAPSFMDAASGSVTGEHGGAGDPSKHPYASAYLQGNTGLQNELQDKLDAKYHGFAKYDAKSGGVQRDIGRGISQTGHQLMGYLKDNWGKIALAVGGTAALIAILKSLGNGGGGTVNNYYGGASQSGQPGPRFM